MLRSLNPYYTGIHLHKLQRHSSSKRKRLNPYYTGIHLHETRHPLLKAQFRLNPYYTGIHLHPKMMKSLPSAVVVLILIILEYIYIK